jgi:hypothetical protein
MLISRVFLLRILFMKLYALSLFLIIGLYSNTAWAQTGCLMPSTGTMYTTKTGSKYTGGAVTNPHSLYCIKSTGTCTIRLSNTDYAGTLVSYGSPIGCPLDDYVYVLLGFSGMAGYLILKKKISNDIVGVII